VTPSFAGVIALSSADWSSHWLAIRPHRRPSWVEAIRVHRGSDGHTNLRIDYKLLPHPIISPYQIQLLL